MTMSMAMTITIGMSMTNIRIGVRTITMIGTMNTMLTGLSINVASGNPTHHPIGVSFLTPTMVFLTITGTRVLKCYAMLIRATMRTLIGATASAQVQAQARAQAQVQAQVWYMPQRNVDIAQIQAQVAVA